MPLPFAFPWKNPLAFSPLWWVCVDLMMNFDIVNADNLVISVVHSLTFKYGLHSLQVGLVCVFVAYCFTLGRIFEYLEGQNFLKHIFF